MTKLLRIGGVLNVTKHQKQWDIQEQLILWQSILAFVIIVDQRWLGHRKARTDMTTEEMEKLFFDALRNAGVIGHRGCPN